MAVRSSPRAELERLAGFKQIKRRAPTRLGPQMTQFFKQSVQRQQGKLRGLRSVRRSWCRNH